MKKGWIEIITGSMFCGKTQTLVDRVVRAKIARRKVQVFRPVLDARLDVTQIRPHNNGVGIDAIYVEGAGDILPLIEQNTDVVAIDEAQFFDWTLTEVCDALAERGMRVILAGLDMDFRGEPFGPMPALLAQAEVVDKLRAVCMRCGDPASRSQRLVSDQPADNDGPIVWVGGSMLYEARCRSCFETR